MRGAKEGVPACDTFRADCLLELVRLVPECVVGIKVLNSMS